MVNAMVDRRKRWDMSSARKTCSLAYFTLHRILLSSITLLSLFFTPKERILHILKLIERMASFRPFPLPEAMWIDLVHIVSPLLNLFSNFIQSGLQS